MRCLRKKIFRKTGQRPSGHLGLALQELEEREGNLARLEAAVEAHQKALEVRTRQDFPARLGRDPENLGLALMELGAREGNSTRFEAAVEPIRWPLRYIRKKIFHQTDSEPSTIWASRFRNWRARVIPRFEAAVDAYKLALEVYTQEDFPLQEWAWTQNNLDGALQELGVREGNPMTNGGGGLYDGP